MDRMSEMAKVELDAELDEFETDFASRRATGGIPSDTEIAERLSQWERKYC